jgi:hypothetical protein
VFSVGFEVVQYGAPSVATQVPGELMVQYASNDNTHNQNPLPRRCIAAARYGPPAAVRLSSTVSGLA